MMTTLFSDANRLTDFFPNIRPKTQAAVIERLSGHELLHYTSKNKDRNQLPLLIVPSLISHSYVLDLLPGKSFVEFLTEQGFDVYLLNWGYPKPQDEHIDFTSLLKKRIPFFLSSTLKHFQRLHPGKVTTQLHLFGHCLGGTLATLLTALYPEKIATLSLMTSPLNLSEMGKFKHWIQSSPINYKNMQTAHGNIPWPLLHTTFLSMKPMAQYHRLKRFFSVKMNEEQKRNYFALELWSHDSVAFRGKVFLTLIQNIIDNKNLLLESFLLEDGTKIEIKNISVPVLNLASKEDHIVPYASPVKKQEQLPLCPEFKHIDFSGGHVGCLVSKKTQDHLWPQISNWLEDHSHEA